ncbi:MAG: T9SS type A sorting domain-containing protein [Bacteroidetes bacterium]|nr:T9SS type A sorting domain-containing protein [Bacteroidota bacterium]MCA6442188.1 T9SS type A sorting domain-containing protein [Bacteroidota bacterium]
MTINGTTAIVDNSLVNGIYLLRISSKHGTNTNKIIVSK